MASARLLIALLIGFMLLSACAPMQPSSDDPEPVYRSPLTRDADAALALGDRTSALTLLRMAADNAPTNAAATLRLQAAFFAYQLNDPEPARRLLTPAKRSSSQRRRAIAEFIQQMMADDAPAARQTAALSQLQGLLPARLEPYRQQALADARSANAEHLAAIDHYLRADRLHTGASARLANEASLWQALMRIPFADVQAALQTPNDSRRQHWLTLAMGVQQRLLDPAATKAFLDTLERPAMAHSGLLTTRILASQRAALSPARRVAVLLPLSGDLARAGQQIQRGILAALYAQDHQAARPKIQFIDVGDDGLSPAAAYQRAITEGAGQIIGPLAKASVRELLNETNITTPVILLNRINDAPRRANAYQFGLAPEDDAEAAARLAYQNGHERLVTLGGTSEWDRRVIGRFQRQFESLGGDILERGTYPPDQEDMRAPIEALFNLDASAARYERLRDITRQRFEFEPRRRGDMDAAFIAAFEGPARLVVPQMRFHRGIDLPLYATSASYPAHQSDAADGDLQGLMLPVMPWLTDSATDSLSTSARALLVETDQRASEPAELGELIALGIDSYRLLGSLPLLEQYRHLRLNAATGRLYVNDQGQVKRNLDAARITAQGLQRLGRIDEAQDDTQ